MSDIKPTKSQNSVEIKEMFSSAISVDCVVFGVDRGKLKVLLYEREDEPFQGKWAVPGDFVFPGESPDLAASRVLQEKTALNNVVLEQAKTFGETNRHPWGNVVTVSYYSLLVPDLGQRLPQTGGEKVKWFHVKDVPELAFDHNEIFEFALKRLRELVRNKPIGFEFLPQKFTLTQLQAMYESLLGFKLDKRNFRKKILAQGVLEELDEVQSGVPHRPAQLYYFNYERYQKFVFNGSNFLV